MKTKVFISHSSVDKPFVRKLKKDLALNYIDTWLDEDEMLPGDILDDMLDKGLNDSSHLIIVLSPNSIKSRYVKYELEFALKLMEESSVQKIIPILYRSCPMPEDLEKRLWLDLKEETIYCRHGALEFYGDRYYSELDRLIRAIKQPILKLTTKDKETILGKRARILGVGSNGISIAIHIVGFKSISSYLSKNINPDLIVNFNNNSEKLIPVVLPTVLKKYFESIKFGNQITFKKGKVKTQGHYVNFSQNNTRIALPMSIRHKLKLKQNQLYDMKIDTSSKVFEFQEMVDI